MSKSNHAQVKFVLFALILIFAPAKTRNHHLPDPVALKRAPFSPTLENVPPSSSSHEVFRFHLPTEPHSLDPARMGLGGSTYLFHNLMRGLYTYSDHEGLKPEGAQTCEFKGRLKLVCQLNPRVRWSDGQTVVAGDYVRAFRHLVSPSSKTPGIELLQNVRNALEIHAGGRPLDALGVHSAGESRLIVEFNSPDPDFLFKLTSDLLVPLRSVQFSHRSEAHLSVFNGPYRVKKWAPRSKVILEPNPYYLGAHSQRPHLEAVFVEDDETALRLYERGRLDFLRRLPTLYIAKYRHRPDFWQIPVARFDYIGFGPELRKHKDLRSALIYSVDFEEFSKLHSVLGRPGCTGLPERFLDRPRCYSFDLMRARKHWARVPPKLKQSRLKFKYSKLGGDDIERTAQWYQAQWLKHLNFRVDLEATEQGHFLSHLRHDPPAVFRKGVSLDRPTCLAALETFAVNGSENFLKLEDEIYERFRKSLMTELLHLTRGLPLGVSSRHSASTATAKARRVCGLGVQRLLDQHLLIPQGRIQFTILARPHFAGWQLNEMNQLDLSNLHIASGIVSN